MAYLVEMHLEICLAPELSSETHSLLEQLRFMAKSKELLRFARFEKNRMPVEIQGRRSFPTLFELGFGVRKKSEQTF